MTPEFKFVVVERYSQIPASATNVGYLEVDNWNDWFEFQTLYSLTVFDEGGKSHRLGGVKIGEFGFDKNQSRPKIPTEFPGLGEEFFSLGQDDSYYETLAAFSDQLRTAITVGLRDVVAMPALFERALEERVMGRSLLRSVSTTSIKGQFRRLLSGGARLSKFEFTYKAPPRVGTSLPPLELSFSVEPESFPPTNIHVLIGRNGVGKTYVLNLMTKALLGGDHSSKQIGAFDVSDLFANVVSVTFSAFDPFEPLPELKDKSEGIHYSYIGLKRSSDTGQGVGSPKSPEMLAREFVSSLAVCATGARLNRWRLAVEALQADPIFKEADVASLVGQAESSDFNRVASSMFNKLSSGHKIVLLTITRLVETVEERSLVLLDEPEAHLHPPLLSAFVRSLSDLLVNRNGVAIIATHSPVVLQEVPRKCAWKIRRTGAEVAVERPEIETFGENVGILTREVFGLEVTQSGFHRMVRDAVTSRGTYDGVVQYFGGELGAEAKAIVQALVISQNASRGQ